VLQQAKHGVATSLEALLTTIRDAGFTPVQRTTAYDILRRFDDLPNAFAGPLSCARGNDGAPRLDTALAGAV